MRDHGAENSAEDLRSDVEDGIAACQFAFQRKYQRDRRIEVGSRDRSKNGDEHDKDSASRQRVAEQRKRRILGERLGHDAGPDHGCNQKRCAERFSDKAAWQVVAGHQLALSWPELDPSMRPISRSLVPSESLSMPRRGRLVKILMRFLR